MKICDADGVMEVRGLKHRHLQSIRLGIPSRAMSDLHESSPGLIGLQISDYCECSVERPPGQIPVFELHSSLLSAHIIFR